MYEQLATVRPNADAPDLIRDTPMDHAIGFIALTGAITAVVLSVWIGLIALAVMCGGIVALFAAPGQ